MTQTPPPKRPPRTVSDDEIRDLLEQAGHRAEIPTEDFLAIKANARAAWMQLVDARASRQRWWGILSPLAAAVGILLLVGLAWVWRHQTAPPAPASVATVELLSGDVRLAETAAGGDVALEIGAGLPAGTALETRQQGDGTPGLVALRLAAGQSLRLSPGGRARLVSAATIELLAGAVYVDSDAASEDSGVVVLTPYGSVTDIGTQFEVRLGATADGLRVRVRRGLVALAHANEQHTAKQGEELAVAADGSVDRALYDPIGPDWDWVLSAAPTLEIQGVTLSRFLDWVARETSLVVEFEDEALAGAATAIELHGSIDGLRPDEAVHAVLPGTGLDYQIEAGKLRIERLAD